MAGKKIPMRMCVGCRQMKPKAELVRIVKITDGEIKFDSTGKLNGRGAYICKEKDCLMKSQKAGALQRAFETKIDAEIYDMLYEEISNIE